MELRRFLAVSGVLAACVVSAYPAAQAPSAMALLERYAAGEFDAVVAALGDIPNFEPILKDIKNQAPAWIEAGGADDKARRDLAAATFALEAARADEWHEWKRIVKPPTMSATLSNGRKEEFNPLNTLYWSPAPLLIEWGCALLRKNETPQPSERWWHLAALAVAQRSEDMQFLIGDVAIGQGRGSGEIINEQKDIKHLEHAEKRFPNELRFKLAQGIARFRVWPDDARMAFGLLKDKADVGGEALMRLGEMQLRDHKLGDALTQFDLVERNSRDPYVLYLARFLRASVYMEQKQVPQAEAAYRSALTVWPRAQSASTALAALLVKSNRTQEAEGLAAAMVKSEPPMPDPWREFVHADDRFWPQLIAHLRREISR